MAIVQISKLQARSGNLIDLPQLDQAEFGFASDVEKLYIGKTDGNIKNIEVLTSYSNITFSQIDGAANANLNLANLANGQILGIEEASPNVFYVTNKGTGVGGLVSLGNISNIKISGGTVNGILTTDGSGNLSFQNLGTLSNLISGANTQVQFNNNGAFGASANFTFNFATNVLTVAGNISSNNLTTSNVVTVGANANVLGNINVSADAVVGGLLKVAQITTGAVGNAGNITGNWTLTAGSRFQATYADLAEYYEADKDYEPGTVLEFGGDKEVTLAVDGTCRVAGVVSTNPAYVMNVTCKGIAVAIALQGRTPVKVRGQIQKGDLMISGGNGYARPSRSPNIGSVIGKSLENFNGIEGVIEIAVGRI